MRLTELNEIGPTPRRPVFERWTTMRQCLHFSLILLLAGAVLAADDEEAKRSGKAERTAKAMRGKIQAEIKKLGNHAWAGEYYAGDGLGVNTSLILAPAAGYVFEWHGCLGLYDRNYGAVTWTNGRVRLSFTFKNEREGFQGIAPELVPIAWGSRHYLIPPEDIVGFCNEINQGGEPRPRVHGFHLLRRGDETNAVTGLPKLPNEFRAYLVSEPIEATIVAVGKSSTRPSVADWKFKDTPVTLDAGTQQGLRVGMELVVWLPRNIVEHVRITQVEQDRSEGIVTQVGEEKSGPEKGWRVSTQAPWHAGTKEKQP